MKIVHLQFVPLIIMLSVASGCGESKADKMRKGQEQLTKRVSAQLQAAKDKADECDFDAANNIISDLRDEVSQSPFANQDTCNKLTTDIDAEHKRLSTREVHQRRKIRDGWRVIGGKLVSPEDQSRALAQQKQREEAEAARAQARRARAAELERAQRDAAAREAERRRAEAEAREEEARRARATEEAERELRHALSAVPSLQIALDDALYRSASIEWVLWSLRTQSISLGATPDVHPDACLIGQDEVLRRIDAASEGSSQILLAYRKEISSFIRNTRWPLYITSSEAMNGRIIPVRFAEYQNKAVLILGPLFSDTVFNNINQTVNTAKKRAASFAQSNILPVLLETTITDRFENTAFEYVGYVFAYGNRNFVRDTDTPMSELLCMVVSTKDLNAFINRELSQERLVAQAAIFLASESQTFMRIELDLE
ncbi:MAG: hypothetical protein JXO22_17830 [Phycisphaerae bacterium]|nr:hypothetical protein [Phycisphaerae bacterium]